MQTNIVRTANKFIDKTLKGKAELNSVISFIGSKGYQFYEYKNGEESNLIEKYGLSEKVRISHAFTINDEETKGVFFNSSLSAESKKLAIYHEAAHIALGHLDSSDLVVNERIREMQAEAFAYQLLTYKKSLKKILFRIIITVLIASGAIFGLSALPERASITGTEYVYITPSGAKYHKESCYYIKGHKTTVITRSEAQKTHEPCLICNP